MHQTMKGITIINARILTGAGTDRNYAAALDWIICTGCGRHYDLPTEADQVMRVAVQQDGIGRVLVQCKDIEACYEQWSSIVTCF
jgi:hypothetical protein